MTLSRPTAVMAMISAATISVNQAAAGMAGLLSSAEQLGDGSRVPDRADRDFLDGLIGDGQRLGQAVQFADEGNTAGQDVIGRSPDPLHRGKDAVKQVDDHGQDHDEQNHVADPPQDHGSFSIFLGGAFQASSSFVAPTSLLSPDNAAPSARGLVGQEETAEDPA